MSGSVEKISFPTTTIEDGADVADIVPRLDSGRFRRPNMKLLMSLFLVILLVVVAIAAPLVAPYSPTHQDFLSRLKPPGYVAPAGDLHLLGTDQFGRDILSRLIFGIRIPLVIATLSALLGSSIGLSLGLSAGYFGSWVDAVISVLIDSQLSMPFILVALLILTLFGPSAYNIILAFTFMCWPVTARVARAEALRLRGSQFVTAAYVAGARSSYILWRHILPNALSAVVAVAATQVAGFIIYEAALGFFGLGVPPPEPTWGNMLADARNYLRDAWWMGVCPGAGITLVALIANMLGEGLREMLNPE